MSKTGEIFIRFGSVIREIRLRNKMSQEELADICGLHRTYISDIELGKRNISLENIERIAIALNVSIEYIFSKVEE